jgi:predicted nuclease of predicted toxin-antitoxin system
MRVKIDENLPAVLETILTTLGHNVDTVPAEGLAGRNDDEVLAASRKSGRFLLTQDLHFSDSRRMERQRHPGVLLLRLRNPNRVALIARIAFLFEQEDVQNWEGCIVIATETKVRIRRGMSSRR